MRFEHLEYFVKVVQCGSINQAAAQLYISQPHLSRIIKDMEEDAGTRLLSRQCKGVVLTEDGRLFLEHAQNVLREMGALNSFARNKKNPWNAFRVSMTKYSHIMESFMEVCVAHQYDDAFDYQLREGTPLEVANDVAEGRADIGVLHFDSPRSEQVPGILKEKGLSFHTITITEPHFILSKNHTLITEGKDVDIDTLAPYGFVRYIGNYEDFTYQITVNGRHVNLNESNKIVSIHGRASLMYLISISDFYSIGIQDFKKQQPLYDSVSLPIKGVEDKLEFAYLLPQNTEPNEATKEFIENLKHHFKK